MCHNPPQPVYSSVPERYADEDKVDEEYQDSIDGILEHKLYPFVALDLCPSLFGLFVCPPYAASALKGICKLPLEYIGYDGIDNSMQRPSFELLPVFTLR